MLNTALTQALNKVDSLQLALENTSNDSIKEDILNQLCWSYFKSDPGLAIGYAKQQLKLGELHNDEKMQSRAFDNLSYLYKNIGNWNASVSYYIKALDHKEKNLDTASMLISLQGIGSVYYLQKNMKKSKEYWEKCLSYYRGMKNDKGISSMLNNLALIDKNSGDYQNALKRLRESSKIDSIKNDSKGLAQVYANIGELFESLENYQLALDYYSKSNILFETSNSLKEGLTNLVNLSSSYRRINQFDKALQISKLAEERALLFEDKVNLESIYLELSLIKEKTNFPNQSLLYHKKMVTLKEELYNKESATQVAEMETRFETDKKEKQIELQLLKLDHQNLEIERKQMWVMAIGGGLCLVFILSLVLWRSNILKHKSNQLITKQKLQIEIQHDRIVEHQENINDSIHYAKRLQNTILPDETEIYKHIPQSFIIFSPRDIVSGDFYWFYKKPDCSVILAADCTGHGIPGAFVSMLCNNIMNQVVIEQNLTDPGQILSEVNRGVLNAFQKKESAQQALDGMDCSLCVLWDDHKTMQYSGAGNPLYLIRGKELLIYKSDNHAIGGVTVPDFKYNTHHISLQKDDSCFLLSDGYPDQFGGSKGKKFLIKNFRTMITEIGHLDCHAQKETLLNRLKTWKGQYDQVDDILVIGFKV